MKLDRAAGEIELKVVYYGPGLAGKTTNLQYVYARAYPEQQPTTSAFWSEYARTMSFSFVAKTLGVVNGWTIRFRLYSTPSSIHRDPVRREVLEHVDGVIFVADSQVERSEANLECLEDLRENLESHGLSLPSLAFVLQYNKQDLPNAQTVVELDAQLNRYRVPAFGATARTGVGVFDTLKSLATMMLDRIRIEPSPSGTPYRD